MSESLGGRVSFEAAFNCKNEGGIHDFPVPQNIAAARLLPSSSGDVVDVMQRSDNHDWYCTNGTTDRQPVFSADVVRCNRKRMKDQSESAVVECWGTH